jgi:hypothetical protein
MHLYCFNAGMQMKSSEYERSLYKTTTTTTTTQILVEFNNQNSLSLGGMHVSTKHCQVITAASLATALSLDRATL